MNKCCDKIELYVESDSKIHKERIGEFIVMCKNCGWSDKFVYMDRSIAEGRKTDLEKSMA